MMVNMLLLPYKGCSAALIKGIGRCGDIPTGRLAFNAPGSLKGLDSFPFREIKEAFPSALIDTGLLSLSCELESHFFHESLKLPMW